jgi:hypothetical protein
MECFDLIWTAMILDDELTKCRAVNEMDQIDQARFKKIFEEGITRFKEIIYSNVPRARQALRKLLDAKIMFIPDPNYRTYRFEEELRIGAFLKPIDNTAVISQVSPTGFEPVL